ncbi:beta-hydroxyacyl-ACP dehydratase [Luedemannella helvata]|uniref:Beta-hydroxyacyl-ACP dehydratase n=1 Tax=Luedemannella helvata TaxID=349315 RepID=A0ABN2KV00_9ACTN
MDRAQVRRILPHGPPMVLVDEVEWLDPGQALRAVRTIDAAEPCFAGLPPGRHAYPVSLMLESFGQAAALLWYSRVGTLAGPDQVLMFAAGRDCRFDGPAYPDEVLRHHVRLDQVVADTAFASGEIYAGERRVATIGSLIAVVRPVAVLGD